jgi:hypothetical protein
LEEAFLELTHDAVEYHASTGPQLVTSGKAS